jgi:hypothetical protein
LHVTILANGSLPMSRYWIPFYGMTFVIYKFNMHVIIEKWKPRKEGLNVSHIILIEPTWVHQPNLHLIPMEWLTSFNSLKW